MSGLMRYRPKGASPDDPRLGRYIPDDRRHVELYPYSADTVASVEQILRLPSWHWTHDQARQGSCVPHGTLMERAITNTQQNKLLNLLTPGRRYDPLILWDAAKLIDQWSDTNPGDDNGTSVRAAYDVLRTNGARRIKSNGITIVNDRVVVTDKSRKLDPAEGVQVTRWATSVDLMRTALANKIPVAIGVTWYSVFDAPMKSLTGDFWMAPETAYTLGKIRGGHCVCIYGASDKRQAFKVKNSWGREYPLVWLPYKIMQRLLDEEGEAALVVDR